MLARFANSHVAILARAMGVPALMGVNGLTMGSTDGKEVIDAYNNYLYISPSSALKKEFKELAKEDLLLDQELEALRDLPAETTDGHAIELFVNTGLNIDPQLLVMRALKVLVYIEQKCLLCYVSYCH